MFVHGNLNDACNWKTIADYLNNEGWSGDELWAITFREGTSDHGEMRRQLDDFVQNVMNQTGKSKVHVVAHSLGVTGVRFWMDRRDRYDWVETFVGFNGGNHGVCVCPGCYDTSLDGDFNGWLKKGEACQFIAVQCFSVRGHSLYEINLPDETPASNIDYKMTRGLYDPLYYCNVFSPYLDGAQNDYFYTD
ncbi:MAG: esterase/lipase family protein, partial [Gemmatimonadota bacterium]